MGEVRFPPSSTSRCCGLAVRTRAPGWITRYIDGGYGSRPCLPPLSGVRKSPHVQLFLSKNWKKIGKPAAEQQVDERNRRKRRGIRLIRSGSLFMNGCHTCFCFPQHSVQISSTGTGWRISSLPNRSIPQARRTANCSLDSSATRDSEIRLGDRFYDRPVPGLW